MGFLKFLTLFDWISPMGAAVDLLVMGHEEIAVPDGLEHDAERILKRHGILLRGHRYDPVHDAWCLRIAGADARKAAKILEREFGG